MDNGVSNRGVSAFPLKVVAIVAMTCNHAGNMYAQALPASLHCAFVAVGGLTFPIMAFLVSEGCVHTSDVRRYALRMLVFAALAQPPYALFLSERPNVMFTLLAGIGCVEVWRRGFLPAWARAFACVAVCLLTMDFDWGGIGPAMVLVASILRERPLARAAVPCLMGAAWGFWFWTLPSISAALPVTSWLPYGLYSVVGNPSAIVPLAVYDGRRGRYSMKWLFYAYYPAHIVVLGVAGMMLGIM